VIAGEIFGFFVPEESSDFHELCGWAPSLFIEDKLFTLTEVHLVNIYHH
jgi:hypothetical protein